MDLSEPGFGVALLNDCKYGHSCLGNVMGMSLLRSPTFPDPTADRAVHRFTYALMPHGLFDAALLTTVAADMNQPGRVLTNVAATGPLLALRGEHRDAVVIETVKPAEDGDGVVVRLWESLGGRGTVGVMFNRPVRSVQETDLLERPLAPARADGPVVSLSFTPFQIRTIKVKF
jgi:alpha-mannosidase